MSTESNHQRSNTSVKVKIMLITGFIAFHISLFMSIIEMETQQIHRYYGDPYYLVMLISFPFTISAYWWLVVKLTGRGQWTWSE